MGSLFGYRGCFTAAGRCLAGEGARATLFMFEDFMNTGTIEFIYIAPKATAPTLSVKEVLAIPGVGPGRRPLRSAPGNILQA